jgi:hypothetical protein
VGLRSLGVELIGKLACPKPFGRHPVCQGISLRSSQKKVEKKEGFEEFGGKGFLVL